MGDFLDDILVWSIIFIVLGPLIFSLIKNKKIFVKLVRMLLIVGSIPAAYMAELSINGCCGAPSSSYQGAGYLLGAGMLIAGLLLIFYEDKLFPNN